LLAYVTYAERAAWGPAVVGVVWIGDGAAVRALLLAKPMAVTLPVVMLILDWYPLRRLGRLTDGGDGRRLAAEKLPLVAMVAASCVVTVMAQSRRCRTWNRCAGDANTGDVVGVTCFYCGSSCGGRGWRGCIPLRDYSGNLTNRDRAWVLVALGDGGSGMWRRVPIVAAALAAYAVALLPVIGLVQVGTQGTADRYSYLPVGGDLSGGGGVCGVVVAAGGSDEASRRRRGSAPGGAGWRAGLAVAAGSRRSLLARATREQIPIWNDPMSLWGACLERTTDQSGGRSWRMRRRCC